MTAGLASLSRIALTDRRTTPAPARRPARARRPRPGWARLPWSVLLAAGPLVIGVVRLSSSLGQPFTSGGDDAFIELGVRGALHHLATVGPYSRFGWHHPGPLLFDLFAPLYAVTGDQSRALFLDSWLLNAVCVLGVIAVVRRFAGEVAALAAVALLTAALMATGFSRLIDPWNPSLLALPVLLTLVAAAAASTGSYGALFLAAIAGSFAAQTHLGTVPVVAVTLVVAAPACVVGHRRQAAAPAVRRVWGVVGVIVLVLVWAGPVAGVVVHGRGSNLASIVRFVAHPPASAGVAHHPLGAAVRAALTYPAVVPYGFPDALAAGTGRLAWCAACAAIGLVVAVVGCRRVPFAAALGLATPLAMAVAVIAASRVAGPLEPYLMWWTSLLALPALLGAVILAGNLLRQHGRHRPAAVAAAVAGVAAVATTVGWARLVVDGPTTSYPDSPEARAVAAAVASAVGRSPFRLDVVGQQFSDGPTVLTLAKRGERFGLQPPLDLYTGTTRPPADAPVVVLATTGTSAPPGATLVARAGTLAAYLLGPDRPSPTG